MSGKPHNVLAASDSIMLRLNKLLAAPGGLSAFLSTFNYTLYLLAHLDAKTNPLKARLYALINRASSTPKVTPAVPTGPSPFAVFGSLLSNTRTTLRLFGLFPLYAWGRQLAKGPKPGEDGVLYATAVTQCALYTAYQFLENVAYLTDAKVLTEAVMARWTASAGGKTTDIYRWSYRLWMLGVVCDLVRLGREAQLERALRARRTAPEKKDVDIFDRDKLVDQRWRAELVSPAAWLPVAVHCAEWTEGGIPGFDLGVLGICGWVAGVGKFKALWDATASM